MNAQMLELTVDEFLRGPQEIVLLNRHGQSRDDAQPAAVMGAHTRHAMEEVLHPQEVDCHITFKVGDAVVRLKGTGYYEREGRLCRVVYISVEEAEARKREPEPRELAALQIGGWVASHRFATTPKALRLYYYVFASRETDAEVCETWYREFPLASDGEIRPLIADRTQRIAQAFTQPDVTLPECTLVERGGTTGTEYSKCRYWCPARTRCHQIKRYYDKENERWLAGERALASIIAQPEELSIIDQDIEPSAHDACRPNQ